MKSKVVKGSPLGTGIPADMIIASSKPSAGYKNQKTKIWRTRRRIVERRGGFEETGVSKSDMNIFKELSNDIARRVIQAHIQGSGSLFGTENAITVGDGTTHLGSCLPDDLGKVKELRF